jgi:SNF2 family DNA or RNA helicase
MALKGDAKVILTGTPLQNHLGEMWNLFQFINPGMLGPWQQFVDKYIKSPWDDMVQKELKDRTRPFILRRTKNEVLADLPEKISYEQMVELSPEELQIYEKIRKDVELKFKKHKTKAEKEEAAALQIGFFQELTRLRLLANSVSLVYPEWKPESSKIAALRDILTSLRQENGNRVLIFSQFTSFLSQIGAMMKDSGFDYLYLDGQTPLDERQRLVDSFQAGESQFFLISLKAGGLGLNLTAANYVILMDPWWNPSIEDQATDRAHRLGQERNVTVIRLVSANTIEEKILKLHEQKQDLSDKILEGTSASAALTMDEILDMVSPYR